MRFGHVDVIALAQGILSCYRLLSPTSQGLQTALVAGQRGLASKREARAGNRSGSDGDRIRESRRASGRHLCALRRKMN
jgi:hypothetical protein